MKIEECLTEAELSRAFPVIQELRPSFTETQYLSLINTMQNEGYRVFIGLLNDKPVSYAGILIRTNLYDLKHIWVDDLVTIDSARSKGCGLKMIQFLEELAQQENCQHISLSSGFQRIDAHRFYLEKGGFEKCSYQFRKKISP